MVLLCEPLCHFGDRYAHAHFLHIQPNQRNPHRLYFTTFPHPPLPSDILNSLATESGNRPRVRGRPKLGVPSLILDDEASYYYFTVDDKLVYMSFFQDWGPLNIAMVYKACILIHELLEVHSTTQSPRLTLNIVLGFRTKSTQISSIFVKRPQKKGQRRLAHGTLFRPFNSLYLMYFAYLRLLR